MDRESSSAERRTKAAHRTSHLQTLDGGAPAPDWYLYYYMYRLSTRPAGVPHPSAIADRPSATVEVNGNGDIRRSDSGAGHDPSAVK